MTVGDVLVAPLFGIIVSRIFCCFLGSVFASSKSISNCFRFASLICFCSLFLYSWCFCVFSIVGLFIACSCSLCCFCILRLNFGVHQNFLLCFGRTSCCSIPFCIASCMSSSCWLVVVVF